MDASRGYHPKWSKSERERQIPYDNTYIQNRNQLTNMENRLVVSRSLGEGWIVNLGLADVTITYRMETQQGPSL